MRKELMFMVGIMNTLLMGGMDIVGFRKNGGYSGQEDLNRIIGQSK